MGLDRAGAHSSAVGLTPPARCSMAPFQFVSGAATHVGCVRKLNEDAFLDRTDLGLWAVADGMGGHDAGDHASRLTIAALDRVPVPVSAPTFLANVKSALSTANDELRREAVGRGLNRIIATTVIALLTFDRYFTCVWAGDSRLYLWRDRRLEQFSRDHSYVQELVDSKLLTPEEARHHPQGNVVTRAVGASDQLELQTRYGRLRRDDLFVLCSDGLCRELEDDDIGAILTRESLFDLPHALIDTALARGARDNVTVVAVQCRADE